MVPGNEVFSTTISLTVGDTSLVFSSPAASNTGLVIASRINCLMRRQAQNSEIPSPFECRTPSSPGQPGLVIASRINALSKRSAYKKPKHEIPDHLAITNLEEVNDVLVPKKMEVRKRSREEAIAMSRKQHIADMLERVREVLLRPPKLCATETGTKKFSAIGQKEYLGD